MPAARSAELPEVRVCTRAEWRDWLARHHASSGSVWLVYPKQAGAEYAGLEYGAMVEEALCFGWIDSVARAVDDAWGSIRMSPRKPTSGWSRTNKVRVERLVADGRMTPAGLAAIEVAKANGAWASLDASEALAIPVDLARALRRDAAARRHFDAFPPGARKMIIAWVTTAKRPETRERRVAETVRLAAENRRASDPAERAR